MIIYDPFWEVLKNGWKVMHLKKDKHLGIRIDNDNHYKLRYISMYEGRSVNRQVLYLIRKCIMEFESKYDEIKVPTE